MTATESFLSADEKSALRHGTLRNVALAMVQLQNLGFTTTEGSFTTLSDLTYAMPDAKPYAGYHQQDRDSAIRSGILYISYGPIHDNTRDDIANDLNRKAAATAVVGALKAEGLSVIWDGDTSVRIRVDLDA